MTTNAPPGRKKRKATREALIVLGMHRTGTSALSGVLAMLGAQVAKSLMPPTPDNPKGYWESTAIMKFHDRVLKSAGTCWSDWDDFNPHWIDSPAGSTFLDDISSLLEAEYGDSPLILIKDPRMCRLFPMWVTALKQLGISPKVVIPLRHPVEVARSLEVRDHLTRNQASLLWLRHLLDAEHSSRAVLRAFVRYSDLLDDWRTETGRLSKQLHIKWPRQSSAVEAEINEYVTPQFRHHTSADHSIPGDSAIARWVSDAYRAVDSLTNDPSCTESLRLLDSIRQDFSETARIYAPVIQEQRRQYEQRMEALRGETQRITTQFAELDTKHQALQEENQYNYQLYDADHKALIDLRKQFQEREDARSALVSKYEIVQAEAAAHAEQARSAKASEAETVSQLEHLKVAARSAEETLKQRVAATVMELNAEVDRLRNDARLAQESLEERFTETAQLTSTVLDLEERLVAEKLAVATERKQAAARLEDTERTVSERDRSIRTLQTKAADNESRILALERELDAQKAVILEYNATLEALRSGRYRRLVSAMLRSNRTGLRLHPEEDERPDYEVLRRSHLFDKEWYLAHYPDVLSCGMDPIKHYLEYGAREERDPCAAFSTAGYVSRYPDVAKAGINPLVHYLKYGRREGRDVSVIDMKANDAGS